MQDEGEIPPGEWESVREMVWGQIVQKCSRSTSLLLLSQAGEEKSQGPTRPMKHNAGGTEVR